MILDWQIARALTSGSSATEAGILFGMGTRAVASRGASLHLALGSVFLCDQGKPFREQTLRDLYDRSGFLAEGNFEKAAGLKRGAAGRASGGPQAIRTPEIARSVIGWRDRTIQALATQRRDRNRQFHTFEILHTLLPGLAHLRDAIVEVFVEVQIELEHYKEWKIADVWNFVTERARREGERNPWFRVMCFLHEIEIILAGKLDQLRQAESVADFTREILGDRYGVHPQQIKLSMQSRARTIPPAKMLGLILSVASAMTAPAAPESKKEKKAAGRPEEKREVFLEAKKLHAAGFSWPKCAQRLTPHAFAEDPRKASTAVRIGVKRLE